MPPHDICRITGGGVWSPRPTKYFLSIPYTQKGSFP